MKVHQKTKNYTVDGEKNGGNLYAAYSIFNW